MKPFVQIGFMPQALSSKPVPYKHEWAPGVDDNRSTRVGVSADGLRQVGRAGAPVGQPRVAKYGKQEVESWYWEVWNEPDIGYWRGTPEEYQKLYDYAADGVKRALPTARVGGPEVTGPNGARTQQIFRDFLEHCLRGTNYATGRTGRAARLHHLPRQGRPPDRRRPRPDGDQQSAEGDLQRVPIVASFPELQGMPIVIGESDPEGCAACSMRTNPENAYRNGTMSSSYTAAQIARTYELARSAQGRTCSGH